MKKLKEEMEGVVKELAENNHFLERSVCSHIYLEGVQRTHLSEAIYNKYICQKKEKP